MPALLAYLKEQQIPNPENTVVQNQTQSPPKKLYISNVANNAISRNHIGGDFEFTVQ